MERGFEASVTDAEAFQGATQAESAATSSLFGQLQFDEFASTEDQLDPLTGEPKMTKADGELITPEVRSKQGEFPGAFAKIRKVEGNSFVEHLSTTPTPGYARFDRGRWEQRDELLFTLIPCDGVKPQHIVQGSIGDCYLLAALANLAHRDPKRLERLICQVDQDTATVSLFHHGELQPVQVDFAFVRKAASLHPASSEQRAQARIVRSKEESVLEQSMRRTLTYVVWPAVIEKAYARFVEEHGADPDSGMIENLLTGVERLISGVPSAYEQITGGYEGVAGRRLGLDASDHVGQPPLAMLKKNRLMSVSRSSKVKTDKQDCFIGSHAYAVLGTQWVADARCIADPAKSIVTLYNPHGTFHTQTVAEFMHSWNQYTLTNDR